MNEKNPVIISFEGSVLLKNHFTAAMSSYGY